MSEPPTVYPVGKRDAGKRLDRFLGERIPRLSRARIQSAIRERVTLSWGVAARPATPVRPGGEVRVAFRELYETPLELTIPVLASGPGWLCVDKPAGVPVHPVARVLENSLIRMLRRQLDDPALRLTHRLDAETTGALLVARDTATARHLARAFYRDRVHKEYLALVAGAVAGDAGRIELPIGKPADSRVFVRLAAGEGFDKPARTGWRVERRYGDRTLLRMFPETGRRHQLRVHQEAVGHPILGDPLYGRPDAHYLAMIAGEAHPRLAEGGPRRLMLHCAKMIFPDPAGEGEVAVEAPIPPDMACHLGPAVLTRSGAQEDRCPTNAPKSAR